MRTSQLRPKDFIREELEHNPRDAMEILARCDKEDFLIDIECRHFPNDILYAHDACPINLGGLIGRTLTPDDWKEIMRPMEEWHKKQVTAKVCHIFQNTLYCFCDEHRDS